MDAQSIYLQLSKRFGDNIIELVTDNPDPYVVVAKHDIASICRYLKETDELKFDYLQSISGVDTTENLHLVYHLFSYLHRHSIVVKVMMPYSDLAVDSVTSIWKAADWHEREQYDLFGFLFQGHPDLRRVLLPEDWIGHPLRKDYEYPEEYHGIDHYREDPLVQFKALDDLVTKAKEAKEAKGNAETQS